MAKSKPSKPANEYDKIFKENLEPLIIPLLKQYFGLEITHKRRLHDKLQTTTERETDFLFEVTDASNQRSLLHIEFQSYNDANMVFRNLEYHGIIVKKYKLPVHHYVFYVGRQKMRMTTELSENMLYKGFEVLDFNQLSYQTFLNTTSGNEIILAILADFQEHEPEAVIRLILNQLRSSIKNPAQLKKYVEQLNVLSRLRNLSNETIKVIETMPITIDIEKDPLYIRGIDRGIELERRLREKAIEQERQKAEAEIEQERQKAEAEIEQERQKAEAERKTTIMELFQAGLSIPTLSQVFRVTEAYIQDIISSIQQNDPQEDN
ncbi:MAG TPA: hypothetical protein PKA00_19375 [Saprospiraceae bacterium]|nr:hypothetical protein [Saprospiraceae bacterium]HMQ85080.1 hypothetical protein [Saprospiraceae bacterium]